MSTITLPATSPAEPVIQEIIGKLPSSDSKTIATELRQQYRRDEVLRNGLRERIKVLQEDKRIAQGRRGGANDAEFLADIKAADAEIRECEAELAEAHRNAGVWPLVQRWLLRNRNTNLSAYRANTKGLSLDKVRIDIAAVEAKIKNTESAPFNADDVRKAVMADLDAMVKAGTPNVLPAFKLRPDSRDVSNAAQRRIPGRVEWPRERAKQEVAYDRHREIRMNEFTYAGTAFTAWALEDTIHKKLNALIDQHAAQMANGLSAAQRAKLITEHRAKLVDLRYSECALIRADGLEDYSTRMFPPCILGVTTDIPNDLFFSNPRDAED
jgi:hypothetical protein